MVRENDLDCLRDLKVLVTGAKGFVGSHLVSRLRSAGCKLVEISSRLGTDHRTFQCDLRSDAGWEDAMHGVDVVVHLASRVHVMNETTRDPLAVYRELNVEGSMRVARYAAQAGVKRLVFLSSIKALGEQTEPGFPFESDQNGRPTNPYGVSKAEAEDCLMNQFQKTGKLEIVVFRPPLVYGKGAGGNLEMLKKVIDRRIPLPLKSIRNRRDLLGINNLCDLIEVGMVHPDAPGHRFVASDGEAVSTPELLGLIAESKGEGLRLFSFSEDMLRILLKGLGKAEVWSRLAGNLEVDLSETSRILEWTPRQSLREGLKDWLN